MGVSPQDVCQQLLHQLRLSNLNFLISETPYSANICLRKRFVKDPKNHTILPDAKPLSNSNEKILENQIHALVNENSTLKSQIESAKKASRETINLLEEKLAKAEASTIKSLKTKMMNF